MATRNQPDSNEVSCLEADDGSSCDSKSTEEEERLRQLFTICDRDGDGLIDCQDLCHMCQLLNIEESVDEIMNELGVEKHRLISFEEFVRCRKRLTDELVQTPESSDNSLGVLVEHRKPERVLRNTADLEKTSCRVTSLYELLEYHEPKLLHNFLECLSQPPRTKTKMPNILEAANSLHLVAISSLKGEILDLSSHLKRIRMEKDNLEKQVSKHQIEKLRVQKEVENRVDQQMTRYEDRITELHGVIAELRKKIEQRQIGVIREEDEFEESDAVQSNKSNDADSVNDNTPTYSQNASLADVGTDLNLELSKVMSELESAIDEHRKLTTSPHVDREGRIGCISPLADKPVHGTENDCLGPNPFEELERRISNLELENESLLERSKVQQMEVEKLRAQRDNLRDERDKLKQRVEELQLRLHSTEALQSSLTPTSHTKSFPSRDDGMGRSLPHLSGVSSPVTKVAELKKLKTEKHNRSVLGAEISSLGLPNIRVAEHLARNIQENSSLQEILQSVQRGSNMETAEGCDIAFGKIHEFEIERERLQSKVDNLRAQVDLLNLTLAESRSHCDHLTGLLGKYESNNTALKMSLNYSDQALEVYDIVVNLLDNELTLLLARCNACCLGCVDDQRSASINLHNSLLSRRAAESTARQFVMRLDHSGTMADRPSAVSPWEDSSTSSTTSVEDVELTKDDELRLRDHLRQLKADRAIVKLTILDLESVHLDPFSSDQQMNPDAQRLDLENAVLMQELMAMKEEKSELKSRNYILEKEKAALEFSLKKLVQARSADVACESAVQTVSDAKARNFKEITSERPGAIVECSSTLPELSDALRREARLKSKVQELTVALEKVSRSSDLKQQQSAGFVNELKSANSALVCAFEKAKKKYLDKMKKMEVHMQHLAERHETQMDMMRQQVAMMENELRRQSCGLSSP